MKIGEFIHDRIMSLLLHLFCMLALSAFLLLTGTSWGVVFIILIVWATGLCAVTVAAYFRQRNHIRELKSIMDGLNQKYLFMECAPKPNDYFGRKIFELFKCSGKSMIEAVSNAEEKQRDYREYIENWVHEIKVPITAIELICENNKSETSRKIRSRLALIEGHVERALYYARLDCVEKDFIIRETSLAETVKKALSRYRFLLTQKNMRVETENLDKFVYTDGKWVEFMLGQFLSNAVKYRSASPVIRICAEESHGRTRLTIKDNGIGIPISELRRIFDKGFTGSNGRALGGSTGMGLYLCRKLAEALGVYLEADSRENEYTAIAICFPRPLSYENER
ncbi:integral membrane sensor signal transduction histidine kinase [Ruminiclostridium papyrosolvens DSM 2782]|uniref:histidine kinase n=1 Tax=Ruminiclostridium papyrosolvens DSM 2782 TaxID=588581 RepID=F1T8J0_9FIRM|nr:sensor histidine kinase [Ruminiclostridium papyrosolvens]EGD49788.1 integral membrane sensor signal transduction histidine kinase [Ruminiclostridium papyrosolvens DSM 2782]WES33085.1 sensor histidine kinase [Ruminiclostridium papyrosolvens DSM 2782]